MDRSEWISRLELLHVRQRSGELLREEDRDWYRAARDALTKVALSEQNARLAGSERFRRSLRVQRAAQVLLEAPDWTCRTMTVDLGAGGFACLLEAAPPKGAPVEATLLLGNEPLNVPVEAADVRGQGGLVRVSFAFVAAAEWARDRIESFLLDGILEQLVFWDEVLTRLRV
ncbi:MAG TPA: PilZ domain-containing protein [Anaeromyxobacter sp.]|nr:PilZ domain-containing protein [Anaeromyxobacter sp.]